MKSLLFGALLAGLLACDPHDLTTPTVSCTETTPLNTTYSKAQQIQNLLDGFTAQGVPGVAVAVYTPKEGYWAGASGFARLEDKTALQICHLQYSQSVAKSYMAVGILKLVEAGKIELDKPITTYLPTSLSDNVTDAGTITVRMLLNHTSGIPSYSLDTDYVSVLLQNPLRSFTGAAYLSYIRKAPLLFKPGSYFQYSDTNYLLLALIANQVHGDHARLIQESVLTPLNLRQTFYHHFQDNPNLVNSYFDRFGDGKLENVSQMQQVNVNSLMGDDGLVAAPLDYIKFLQGLLGGKLLSDKSMSTMMTWVKNKDGEPSYGMGLYHVQYDGQLAYGHGGAGLGAGCALYYFPEKQLYVFMGTNIGTLTDGPYVRKVGEMKDQLLDLLLQ
ncbi:serine hydrolase domain-containing protein [Larkinella knui]|uniref:Class A beta-lactamase-related serine hydrolase n=1 Tax=Larkinella knui TaxID=2025310 RepID=A0A3P1CLR8_9BACT|nr:serine hydrolase domain-containing protein [Larkinella knui]RRB14199.1 class A beta-lactamase-related serine hydrolase [Larkinella knui]